MNSDIVEIHNSCKVKVTNEQSPSTSEIDKLRVTGTCNPIYSIEELILWKANNQQCLWQDFVIPRAATTNHKVAGFGFNCHDNKDELQLTRLVGNSTPKTILCHDYKVGYLEDRFPYGVETDDIYSFFHWSAIDIFIYFSHNIVTIPTLPWLNTAHRHGCKVLGTFITEYDPDKEAWDEILKSEENFTAVIENLAEICRFFKFDGYLLNIENDIPTQHVPRLIEFVKLLTEKLHSISPDHEVIWYDSVIAPSGNLRWQNKLCSLNSVFFDLCDGIFLNYCWSEQDLMDSVSLADVRRHDVYVGVDVFGRGCIGGGGFNSSQAMKLIHKHGLSTAIFAPGWTFEKCSNVELFLRREMLFWSHIWPYLFIHGPVTLPFKTSFCIGRGKNKWQMGNVCILIF
uniref:Endo-beta-N-acetylglucosaminidase mRNA n=1 Tax=Nilaparvata lugens TaxID=108931 RepID=A0A0C5CUF6_NILLU|nr:endo-beta-N-acetylglucosaminidase [Nilaparvata lugens]